MTRLEAFPAFSLDSSCQESSGRLLRVTDTFGMIVCNLRASPPQAPLRVYRISILAWLTLLAKPFPWL
ncbi:uncharacterized protein METZ01_LOCUS251576 [marine metagenome]|uniref:Uncharacterized protein n=1 Tax=marine metagenome TaxID=408172 RepID=A0A382IHH7_9ZZZZ